MIVESFEKKDKHLTASRKTQIESKYRCEIIEKKQRKHRESLDIDILAPSRKTKSERETKQNVRKN